MNSNKKQVNYVSEIDQFLLQFDQEHPGCSSSQQQEIAKHQRVYRLRDETQPEKSTASKKIWDKF